MLDDLRLLLPEFRYRVAMADGTVENELCPVFVASTAGPVRADPAEVAAHRWEPWAAWRDDVLAGRADVSPWSVLQVGRAAGGAVRRTGRGPGPAAAGRPRRRGAGRPRAAAGHRGGRGLPDRPGHRRDPGPGAVPRRRRRGRRTAPASPSGPASRWPGTLPGSTTYVLRRDDERVGRLRLVRTDDGTELAGIQLRPDAQGRGLGTALVRSLQDGGSARHARRRAGQPPRAGALRATGVRPRRPGRPGRPAALGAARRLSHGVATPAARSSRAGTASTSWRARPTSRSRVVPRSCGPGHRDAEEPRGRRDEHQPPPPVGEPPEGGPAGDGVVERAEADQGRRDEEQRVVLLTVPTGEPPGRHAADRRHGEEGDDEGGDVERGGHGART